MLSKHEFSIYFVIERANECIVISSIDSKGIIYAELKDTGVVLCIMLRD